MQHAARDPQAEMDLRQLCGQDRRVVAAYLEQCLANAIAPLADRLTYPLAPGESLDRLLAAARHATARVLLLLDEVRHLADEPPELARCCAGERCGWGHGRHGAGATTGSAIPSNRRAEPTGGRYGAA